MEFAVPETFFRKLEILRALFPTVAKELNFTFPACYTTQAETKKNNRKAETLLLTAEKFSALAATSGYRDYYPERDLDEAWKIVLRNQFHDILDGSSIGPVYDEVQKFYDEAFERGRTGPGFFPGNHRRSHRHKGRGNPVRRLQFPPLGKDGTRHGRDRPRPGVFGDPAAGPGRQGSARSDH